MPRRRNNVLSDLLAIATAVPWWASVALAIGSFVVLRALANGQIAPADDPKQISSALLGGALIGLGQIGQWIVPPLFALGAVSALARKRKVRPPVTNGTGDAVQCPICGGDMVLRTAKRGVGAGKNFWGCTSYPKCKGTRPT